MKYTMRFVWYVFRIAVISTAAFAILVVAFFLAMDSANVYVIVTDGMKARATSALVTGQPSDLSKFFSSKFLSGQSNIDTSPYAGFGITGIKYKLDVESVWCRPWQNKASVTAVESIPELYYNAPQTEVEGKEAPAPPQWQRTRYRITCLRIREGASEVWRIDSIEKIESLKPEPTPTPEPTTYITASPLPTATPSASPTLAPSPTQTPAPTKKK